ncbi:hypothetical protein QYM36_011265 [Artemia franciscana]|uniref:Uncharacterized protein n=1 Tax=Artemia franciscana TaxID=6661 RepID=A0AA88KYP6_ARTSF|nr:hypothetical protein QYM36_011265 [Artemia franciscana]
MLGELFVKVCNQFINEGYPSDCVAGITSIYKGGDQTELKNWRPIANFRPEYRICSKVMTQRVNEFLSRVIGAYQYFGIKGEKAQHILSVLKELVM